MIPARAISFRADESLPVFFSDETTMKTTATTTTPPMLSATAAVMLRRFSLAAVPAADGVPASTAARDAVELELASLGFVMSNRMRAAVSSLSTTTLTTWSQALCAALAGIVAADKPYVPLYRSFPAGIPDDTAEHVWSRVLVHYFQAEDQACLTCGCVGTTHVLNPCRHVVCDRCFDGASYSACPICERHVDAASPFFLPTAARPAPTTQLRFKRLDIGNVDVMALSLFEELCARPQVISPVDKADLITMVKGYGTAVVGWLPPQIKVKENIAHIFGALFQLVDPLVVLPQARAYLRTATDVLRVLAAYSGADPSLQAEHVNKPVLEEEAARWFGGPQVLLEQQLASTSRSKSKPVTMRRIAVRRFKVGKLKRPLRRALLELLNGFDPDALVEDMLRHRSLWVWLGQFLHPHEHADRHPHVARAFLVARTKDPAGVEAPVFVGWAGRLEAAVIAHDVDTMLAALLERPGEFARRFDHALRVCTTTDEQQRVLRAFIDVRARLATPVLLTLLSLLPTRTAQAPVRLIFPKGNVVTGISIADDRAVLDDAVVVEAVAAIEAEVVRRFGEQPAVDTVVVDEALRTVIVPFNERTASRGAMALTRGSSVKLPSSRYARLFLHWCEPEDGHRTDIDLSVAFYDEGWKHVGVCSYYQLKCELHGAVIATSAGDLQSAPFPDGASEFVDVDRVTAAGLGARYAVMVVNAYAGMSFGQLERAYAGVMVRDDEDGAHFDPRTVLHRFDLQGDNGVFMPLAVDLVDDRLHWIDAYAKGAFEMNNVESSKNAIAKIVPESLAYFGSGVRMSMLTLLQLHGAARARRVVVRGDDGGLREHVRGVDESGVAFLARLRVATGTPTSIGEAAVLAGLVDGDIELPVGSVAWVQLPTVTPSTISAADLIR